MESTICEFLLLCEVLRTCSLTSLSFCLEDPVSLSCSSLWFLLRRTWLGNLFTITGRMNCALSLEGRRINWFYLKILPFSDFEEQWLLFMYYLSACLSWSFVLTRSYTQTLVTKILMRAISNVHTGRIWPVGRRFPTHGVGTITGIAYMLMACILFSALRHDLRICLNLFCRLLLICVGPLFVCSAHFGVCPDICNLFRCRRPWFFLCLHLIRPLYWCFRVGWFALHIFLVRTPCRYILCGFELSQLGLSDLFRSWRTVSDHPCSVDDWFCGLFSVCILDWHLWGSMVSRGVQGVKAHPQKLWFVENPGKIPENLSKIPEHPKIPRPNPWNSGQKCRPTLLDFKQWHPVFAEKQVETIFWRKTVGKSCTTTFWASVGEFGQNSFAPTKVCLVLHLCWWCSLVGWWLTYYYYFDADATMAVPKPF